MAAQLTVLTGPPGSGKTERLLVRYRAVLAANRPGAAIWLAPTWRAAAELVGRLLGGVCDGCFSPGVMTFDRFAEAVLEVAPVAVRPISRVMKRQLLRQLICQRHSEARLRHFRPIAETSGLVDLVGELIGELKRLEIWPEHFRQACNARGATEKDAELLEIYEAYQRCLRENQLYDAEGRFWSARDHLGQGQRRPFEHLRLVVADGFTDFTRTQHEILGILAAWVDELLITLPLEAESRRPDLFAKPLGTLAELWRRHPRLAVDELPRPEQPEWPAMAHLERTLFGNPRHAQPSEETGGVEILAAGQQLGEIELIGSRIKRLLSEDACAGGRPVPPGEIAVVFRSLQDVSPLLAEVFSDLGIPFSMEVGQPLGRSPALVSLVALLRLDVEDWRFGDLLAVLGSNYFQPGWPEWQEGKAAVAAERGIRRLQVPRGREDLLRQLDLGGSDPSRLTSALLRRLGAALDELPQEGTLAEWARAWQRLARQTGLLRAIGAAESEAPSEQTERGTAAPDGSAGASRCLLPDRLAWDRLQQALAESDALSRWLGGHPLKLDRRKALDALEDMLASEQVRQGGDESGRVRVLSAVDARALRIPYLFLAGLSERAFPPPDRVDRLYSEAEYQQLIQPLVEEGLPLVAPAERNREEMLLFYETMTRATRRLYLSYPALDESAQPLSPSPYLEEVEQAFGGRRIERTELADLSPVPAGDEPLSATEFRIKALSTALEGDVSLLAGLIQQQPGVAAGVLAGLELTDLRRDRDRFGPAEGMLPGEAAGEQLSARFPLQKPFSATQLEQYASCPYRFFLERVLRLKPVEELALAADYLGRGRLAHELLAGFHRRVNQALARPGSPIELDPAEYDRLLRETFEELLGEEVANPVEAALREVDRRLVSQWIAGYRGQHETYDALWTKCDAAPAPAFFEVSFGREAEGEDPPSTGEPLEFVAKDQTILVSGRIDRIDTGCVAGTTVFNVLDYKTGGSVKFNLGTVTKGTTLQLPLYAIAAAELVLRDRDAVPWAFGYWYLRDRGFKKALTTYERHNGRLVPTTKWEEIRGKLTETIAALVQRIRLGEFPVSSRDNGCTGYCQYSTVCRINQVRSLEKTWQPATDSL